MDPNQWAGLVATGGGVCLAVIATLRYVKNTEADSVDTLRDTVAHLEQQVKNCRAESAQFRRQIEQLVVLLREQGLGVPDGFWDD